MATAEVGGGAPPPFPLVPWPAPLPHSPAPASLILLPFPPRLGGRQGERKGGRGGWHSWDSLDGGKRGRALGKRAEARAPHSPSPATLTEAWADPGCGRRVDSPGDRTGGFQATGQTAKQPRAPATGEAAQGVLGEAVLGHWSGWGLLVVWGEASAGHWSWTGASPGHWP